MTVVFPQRVSAMSPFPQARPVGLPPNSPTPPSDQSNQKDTFFRRSAIATSSQTDAVRNPNPKRAYLPPLPPVNQQSGCQPLRIVYNNDPHEKFKALPYMVSAFSSLTQEANQANRDLLRLNSGDNNVGRELNEWKLNVMLMNMIRYHAATMGNHELDLGSPNYAEGLKLANFPTVVSNLIVPPGTELARRIQDGRIQTKPQVLRDKHGVYGLIGITSPELKQVVSSKVKLQGEKVQSYEETVANVKAQVDWLQKQGINKIIVLSHMGMDLDRRLAQTVPGIDVIVGGHSHDSCEGIIPGNNYLQTPTGEGVLIVQAGKNGQYMGVADVLFNPQGQVIPQQSQSRLFSTYSVSPDLKALALRDSALGPPYQLAKVATAYDCNDNQYHADTVAQFTADVVRAVSQADIAFVRSAEIRSNIEPGAFTDHDLKALMPFKDPVVRANYTGAEILDSLSRAGQGLAKHEAHPGMLHPSGMAFAVNKGTGQIEQAYVLNRTTGQWERLNPQKTYSVALGEFSVSNQEFPAFARPERVTWNSQKPVQAFFELGLNQAGASFRSVQFKDDGRLQITS